MLHAYREGLNDISQRQTSEIARVKTQISRLQVHQQTLKEQLHGKNNVDGKKWRIRRVLVRVEQQLQLHGKQLQRVDGEELLHEYLLDSVPYLREYETANKKRKHMLCETITLEFQQKMNMKPPSEERLNSYKRKNLIIDPYVCTNCGSHKMAYLDQSAEMVCKDCCVAESFGIKDGIASLDYDQKSQLPQPQFTYKPIQHFADLLSQVEGVSTRSIPNELISCLQTKFKQFGVRETDISPADVRVVLKDVQLLNENGTTLGCKYYEDVFYLTCRLNPSFVPVKIPLERKIIFKSMFREVYALFHKNAKKVNPKRKNFLSYPFTAYKFSEANNWREYMPLFSLLKSREKLRTQDMILKLIFIELDWFWRDTI